uniref:Putative secreted protein n=1 Tax=Anopheles darlingi TaxID=43151 RepID=A0A2M4D658_ANODA
MVCWLLVPLLLRLVCVTTKRIDRFFYRAFVPVDGLWELLCVADVRGICSSWRCDRRCNPHTLPSVQVFYLSDPTICRNVGSLLLYVHWHILGTSAGCSNYWHRDRISDNCGTSLVCR